MKVNLVLHLLFENIQMNQLNIHEIMDKILDIRKEIIEFFNEFQ